jgi:thiol-disulfide isomerase/thioredoxin
VKPRLARRVLWTTIFAFFILPDPSAAQSNAKPPLLDAPLKQFIASMTPLSDRQLGPLDGKAVVVTFFASWCPPCRPEFGHLNEVRQTFPEKEVAIMAINLFEGFFPNGAKRRMARFLNATGPNFPVLRAASDASVEPNFGGVDRIPTVYIFDPDGKPAYSFIHQVDAAKTHATAQEVIAALRKIVPR